MKEVYIVSMARTPMGSFGGVLSGLSATDLGGIAVKAAVERAGLNPDQIEQCIMGNVCSAHLGQAPSKQVVRKAGLPDSTISTLINKVCASGMKAISYAKMTIQSGEADIIVAGGMESMSNIPYYVPTARWGSKFGGVSLVDGLQHDGLSDAYSHAAMGCSGDVTAKKYNISREQQDAYAIRSYTLAQQTQAAGGFRDELTSVSIPQRKGDPIIVSEDEEINKVNFSKIPQLKPSFSADGTVTAANASTLNDGASALVIIGENKLKELGLKPLARIVATADAEQEPDWFTTAPAIAAPLALKRAGLTWNDISFLEVNEAFSVVPISFQQILELDPEIINVHGGAVSMGHPLGSSGSRIVGSLCNVLGQRKAKYGLAAICNGGGGASSMIIERI